MIENFIYQFLSCTIGGLLQTYVDLPKTGTQQMRHYNEIQYENSV